MHYRVWCREQLQQHFEALPNEIKPKVQATLALTGAWDSLWADGTIRSHLYDDPTPPVCASLRLGWRRRLRYLYDGTPWDRAATGGTR